ncbi:MAG: tetratricopeptide repeat protein [Desulfovermiculus sp.]
MSDSRQDQNPESKTAQTSAPPASGWTRFVTDNIKTIGLVLAAIIVIAALFSGYSYYKDRTLRNAQQSVDRIMTEEQGKARIEALQEILSQAPKEMQTGLRLQLARLCMQEELFTQAASHWEHIRKDSTDQDLQIIAVLGQASALAGQDKNSQALDLLQDNASQASKHYLHSINLQIATIAEKAENWETALAAYQKVAEMGDLTSQRDEFIEHKIRLMQDKVDSHDS